MPYATPPAPAIDLTGINPIVVDYETYWSDTFTLRKVPMVEYVLSPEFSTHGVAVFDPDAMLSPEWMSEREFVAWAAKVDWSRTAMVGHNLAFDGLIASAHYGISPRLYVDTLGMARAVLGPVLKRFSLDFVAQHLGVAGKLDGGKALMDVKGLRSLPEGQFAALGHYAIQDAVATWDVFRRLAASFPDGEYELLDWAIRCWVEPALVLDADVLERAMLEEEDRRTMLLIRANATQEELRSDPTFARILEELGVVPGMKLSRRTGKPAYAFAKSDVFMEELLNHSDPDVVALAEARVGVKTSLVQTRIRSLQGHRAVNGDLFSVGLQYGAAHTHRLGGTGHAPRGACNVQNFPRSGLLNEALVAPPGCVIINADLSQIECRETFWFAGESAPLGMLARGEDLYSSFAGNVYGRAITKADNPQERQVGKVTVLSAGFGSGADTFRNMLRVQGNVKVSPDFAAHIIKTYRHTYPGVPALWRALDGVLDSMIAGEWLVADPIAGKGIEWVLGGDRPGFYLPSGLFVGYKGLRYVEGRKGRKEYTRVSKASSSDVAGIWGGTGLENLAQSYARDVVMHHLRKINRELRVVMQVHDSVVLLAPTSMAEDACAFVHGVMGTAPEWAAGLPVACEVGVGSTYAEAKKNIWHPPKRGHSPQPRV